jgi:hypothetical protein
MSANVPFPWKMPIVRTLTKSYAPSSRIVNVTQSSSLNRGVAFNIPAHFPAALLNVETETWVDGGGGSGSIGAHPINPATPPPPAPHSTEHDATSSSSSPLRRQRSVNTICVLNKPLIYITCPHAVHVISAGTVREALRCLRSVPSGLEKSKVLYCLKSAERSKPTRTLSPRHTLFLPRRLLKKSASLSCSFGLFGLSGLARLFDLFGLSCLFGWTRLTG